MTDDERLAALEKLARAVREFTPEERSHGLNAYLTCRFCGADVYWDRPESEIQHAPDCAYTLAAGVLSVFSGGRDS
jgi:hypothetical protein